MWLSVHPGKSRTRTPRSDVPAGKARKNKKNEKVYMRGSFEKNIKCDSTHPPGMSESIVRRCAHLRSEWVLTRQRGVSESKQPLSVGKGVALLGRKESKVH